MKQILLIFASTLALVGCSGNDDAKRDELMLEYKSVEKRVSIFENEIDQADQDAQDKIKARSEVINQTLESDIALINQDTSEGTKEQKIQALKAKALAETAEVKRDALERAAKIKQNNPQFIQSSKERLESLKKKIGAL